MSVFWMLLISFGIMQISVMCTTIYLHRTITHRGIEVHPAVAFLMHLHLALFTGIAPREWMAVHRKHHQFSDHEGDPHSPVQMGLWKVFFLNALLYRKEAKNLSTFRKYTPDYRPTLLDTFRADHWGVLAGMAVFVLMFGWAWGIGLFVGQAITYVFLNSSINSLCHIVGYRNFENQATNLTLVSYLTGGEGLHNNHHEYPTAAHFAMRKWEFDPAWPVIRMLEGFRLAKVKPLPVAKAA